MPLVDLPSEILVGINRFLTYESDVNALCQTNARLYSLLNRTLYQHNVKHSNASALEWAVAQGNVHTALKLVEEGGLPHPAADDWAFKQLSMAVDKDHYPMVTLFLDKGIGVGPLVSRENENFPAQALAHLLSIAACRGHVDIIRALLACGVGPNAIDTVEDGRWSPLIAAAGYGRMAVVKLLLDLGGDINYRSESDGTPLVFAAAGGRAEVVAYLIQQGADVEHGRSSLGNALSSATINGHLETIQVLVEAGARPDPVWTDGELTLMHVAWAAEDRYLDVARYLLGHIDIDQKIAAPGDDLHLLLRTACLCGLDDVVRRILESGDTVVNKLIHDGNTEIFGAGWGASLSLAAQGGYTSLAQLLYDYNPPGVRTNENLALGVAVCESHAPMVKLLLEHGADPNAKAWRGAPALSHVGTNAEILEMLLDYGASFEGDEHQDGTLSEEDEYQDRPSFLSKAIGYGAVSVVQKLLDRGFGLDLRLQQNTMLKAAVRGGLEMLHFLLDHGLAIPPPPSKLGEKCMDIAVKEGQMAVLPVFVDRGYTLASEARAQRLLIEASQAWNEAEHRVDFLLRLGANVDAQSCWVVTALEAAAQRGHARAVQLLLARGANPSQCIHHAVGNGNAAVIKALLKAILERGVAWEEFESSLNRAMLTAFWRRSSLLPLLERFRDHFYCRMMYPV